MSEKKTVKENETTRQKKKQRRSEQKNKTISEEGKNVPWPSSGPLFSTAKFLYDVVAPGKRESQVDMIEKLCETVDANLDSRDTVRGRALFESTGKVPFHVRFGEAPVGTGKSLATLVVACAAWLRYDLRSVVATHTHVLQDQMSGKDFISMKSALVSAFGPERFERWKCGVLKSRSSMPCRIRAESLRARAAADPGRTILVSGKERVSVATVESLDELLSSMNERRFEMSEDHILFPLVAAKECSPDCPKMSSCPAVLAARASWPVVVTNHAYLLEAANGFAMETTGPEGEEKIPAYRLSGLCFFDEAHHLVGYRANGRVRVSFDTRELDSLERFYLPGHLAKEFDDELLFRRTSVDILGRYAETGLYNREKMEKLFTDAKKRLSSSSSLRRGADATAKSGAEKVFECLRKISSVEDARRNASSTNGRFRVGGSGVAVIDDGERNLGDDLSVVLPEARAVFCFSGTLFSKDGSGGDDGGRAFEAETGLKPTLPSFSVPSPFTFDAVRIWIPEESPLAGNFRGKTQKERLWAEFTEDFCRRYIPPYLKEDLGGVLVLCSSKRRMERLAEAVADELSKRGASSWLVMVQGERSRKCLARDFAKARRSSVLFGSASFREGFDVSGGGLTWVIVDRLPFPVPGSEDSVRVEKLKEWGFVDDAFKHSLGLMKLHLEQSAGRLVRSADDWGTITVLDGRLLSKWDEWKCASCLPKTPIPLMKTLPSPEEWIETAMKLESLAAERAGIFS